MTTSERHDGRPDEKQASPKPIADATSLRGGVKPGAISEKDVQPRVLARLPNVDAHKPEQAFDCSVMPQQRTWQRIVPAILLGGIALLIVAATVIPRL